MSTANNIEALKEGYSVRPYQPGDQTSIIQLLNLVFNGWPHFDLECSVADHWSWKYEENPIQTRLNSIAVNNGRIIGSTNGIARRVKIGDEIILCCSGADAAVDPKFRGIGVFSNIYKLFHELRKKAGIRLFYAISRNPIMIKYHSERQFILPHKVSEFIKIKDVQLHLKKMNTKRASLYRIGILILRMIEGIRRSIHSLASSNESIRSFRIQEVSRFDSRVDALWNEVQPHYTFIVERTERYLNWRYCDPRGGKYIVKIAESEKEILGYVILRINRYQRDYPIGYIVDVLTLPNMPDVADDLIAHALKIFEKHAINAVRFQVVKGHPLEKTLRKHGFLDTRQRIHVFSVADVTLGDHLEKLEDSLPSKIHFVFGDYDDI